LAFAPASLILANSILPVNRALYAEGSMCIDFKKDYDAIFDYIEKEFKSCNKENFIGLGLGGNELSLAHIGYDIEEKAWCSIVFDTRSDASPDGEWTKLINQNSLDLSHWSKE
jgi:hypothetical protein